MKTGAHSMREALMAQALGDLDSLLEHVEALAGVIDIAGSKVAKQLQTSTAALDNASDKYRLAITAYTESAKEDLLVFTQRKATKLADHTLEELQVSMRAAASAAFRTEASDKAAQLGIALGRAANEFRRSMWSRLAEHGFTAVISSACTAGFLIAFLRH